VVVDVVIVTKREGVLTHRWASGRKKKLFSVFALVAFSVSFCAYTVFLLFLS
jgi:hypothetical protein